MASQADWSVPPAAKSDAIVEIMAQDHETATNWTAVIARCLAYLCLKQSEYAHAPLLDQAAFLEKMGLSLKDQAALIGSTEASLRELARQRRARFRATQNGTTRRSRRRAR